MKDISLKDLLEAGCHFGHKAARWYPKAASYIFAQREGVHIIDLLQTKSGLEIAGRFLADLAKTGGSVIFVGAKRQAQTVIEEAAKRSGTYFLTQRWPGGFLTNFPVMKKNFDRIKDLKVKIADEKTYTKKERLLAKREMDKLLVLYGGVQGLEKLPEAVFIVDVRKFAGAVREATATGVKIIAITDTNVDPEPIDYQIPANDDAVGSIKIVVDYLADCWIEGRKGILASPAAAVSPE